MPAPPFEPAPYPRKRGIGQWLALAALVGGCRPEAEKAPAPRPPQVTLIRHNDGTAQRLAIGAPVRFPGFLYLDIERGAWVGNYLPTPPRPGVRSEGFGPDFVCADLDIDINTWGRLWPLSTKPVTVTGTVVPRSGPDACPIGLDRVRIVPR